MAALSLSIDEIRPMNRWHNDSIRPGFVGSVGDVNMSVRYKQSAPDMEIRWDPEFSGNREERVGSNVEQGYYTSARVKDSNWGGRRNFKIRNGWVYQDLRVPDKKVEPYVGSTGALGWNNKVATIYDSKRTGSQFLPLPGGYQLSKGEIPRGGSFPAISDQVGIEDSLADSIVSGAGRMPIVDKATENGDAVKGMRVNRNPNAGPSRFGRQNF